MKKALLAYVAILFLLAGGFLVNEIANNYIALTGEQWILIVLGFIGIMTSETLETVYKASLQITFSGAILLFLVFNLPLYAVLLLIILYVFLIKLYNTKVKREYHGVLDIKLAYNTAQFMILAVAAHYLFEWLNMDLRLEILVVSSIYYLLNIGMLTGIQCALRGKFAWMPFTLNNYLQFQYFFLIAFAGLIFAYQAFDLNGVIFVLAIVLPLQKTILEKNTYHDLKEKLMYDTLTGAYSRAYLEEYFEERLIVNEMIHIFFIDFDKFKKINDDYGHVIGDKVLRDFVVKIKEIVGDDGKIYRYGGDEFCIILESEEYLESLKRRLQVEELMEFSEVDISIEYGYSCGYYSIMLDREDTFASIMEEVDKRMYIRKECKRGEREC